MNRRRSVTLAAILGVFLAPAVWAADAPAAAHVPAAPEKAEEHYKNIQVLKGVPADDLIPTMQFISASLDQECEFCHVERAPEKDDKKEKQIARKMIAMTLAINRDSFEGHLEVSCFSCHRGAARPVSIPIVAAADRPPEVPAPKAEELPAADPILAKYLQASGGAEAWAKVTSRVEKGSLTGFGDQAIPVEVYAKAPDKRVSIVHTPRGDSITAFDGTAGWLGGPGRPPHDMSAAENAAARLDADLRLPADLKDLFHEFRVRPSEKIDGRDAVRVAARNEGQPPVEFWFDAQSGLLVRLVRYAETPIGRNPTQIEYADYREVEGVKAPYRWTVARPSGRFTIQIDDLRQNEPVEDARFQKAPPPASDAPAKE